MTPTEARAKWDAMSAEERLAMVRECPPLARAWASYEDGEWLRWEGDYFAANIKHRGVSFEVTRGTTTQVEIGSFATLEEAKAAADAALLAVGYVLEGDE